jgi:mannose-6-phosphate isomerase
MLYPLKFNPILKERIWGGDYLKTVFGKIIPEGVDKCGESWELSSVDENLSVVSNGFLAGNDINELIEVYMADLVGERNFEKYGNEFPLLIKFIDTTDFLSIQVHPDDEMAMRLHHAYGKSEMWYIINAESDSSIITGFNKKLSPKEYQSIMSEGMLKDFLKYEQVQSDDFFYIPARHLHSIGKGIQLVEIQQTSDITYRMYDWDRKDSNGKPRELHTELASEAIDFDANPIAKHSISILNNKLQKLVSEKYFTVNRLAFNELVEREFVDVETFRIYICLEGEVDIVCEQQSPVNISAGEVVLIPAIINSVALSPKKYTKVLEVFVS